MKPDQIKRLEFAADLLVDYIIDWNVNTNEVYIPENWKQYLGFTDAEVENTFEGFIRMASVTSLEAVQPVINDLISGTQKVVWTELEVVHKNGYGIWIGGKGKVVEWKDDGSAARIIFVFHEIESRKEIEFKLDKSEARFKKLFNQHSSVMLLIDPGTADIIDANDAALDFYGYSLDQIRSIKITDINGLTAADIMKEMQSVLQKHHEVFIFQHRLASGALRFVEVRSTSIEDNDKTVLFSIVNDIHDKIVNEKLLKEEQESLNGILHALPDLIFKLDADDKFLFCHTNSPEDLIAPVEQFMGRHFAEILPEQLSEKVAEKIQAAKQTGVLQDFRYSLQIPLIGEKWYEARILALDEGSTIAVIRDVTDIVRDNQQLRLLESAVANATDVVLITEAEPFDMPGPKIVFVNDAFEKTTGYSREEVIGKTPRILQGKKSDRNELSRLRKALENWEPCEIETINYKKNGEEFWVNISIVPLANEKGWFTHWVAIQKDITERKRTEAQLIKLSQAVEQSPASIMITDINANVEYVNPAFTKLSGYSADEIIGKNARILKTAHTPSSEFESLSIAIKNKQAWRGEFVNKNKQGELYWENAVISPLLDKDGEVTNFLSVKENITQRKKIENNLTEKLRIIEAGQKVANVGYFIGYFNAEGSLNPGKFTRWDISPTLHSMLNVDSTFDGSDFESWLQLIHPEDRAMASAAYMQALANNRQINLKVRINAKSDVTAGWIKFYGQIEFDSKGRPSYIILYIEDITQVENLLIDRSLIIESIADNFYVIDKNFNFVYYNKNYRTDYLNAKGDEFIGANLFTVFPFLSDTAAFTENLKKAADTGEAVHFEFEVNVNGEFRGWYEQYFYPFATGYSVLFRNITDKKQIEQDLLTLNTQLKLNTDELTNSNTELERFAYVASHDLQEPLRMVSSFMQLFEKKYAAAVDDTGKQYIRFAVEGAERMKVLIRDLLQYSRAGSGSLEIIDVDMNEVMKEVQLIFKNDAAQSNAEIIVTHLPVIRAGKTAMLQLMQNLISNALKYNNKEKAVITISADENMQEWSIHVKDNGIGIEPEYAEKIFVIFQRLHTKEQYGGTGIGLSVCKKIVERYKGKIWVESIPGTGSEFIFTIPKMLI